MKDPPLQARSFIVKVWAKKVEDPSADASWRGHVTHVGSGDQKYLKSLMEVPAFIAPYVNELGGALGLYTRFCIWCARVDDLVNRPS